MSEIQTWYEEAIKVTRVFSIPSESFIIYKGFKITKTEENEYFIKDVRFTNMYSNVNDITVSHFKKFGFVKGVDIISFKRDTKRIDTYKKRTVTLYDKRKKAKKEISKDRRLNEKRIRNIDKKIDEYVDLIFYYQTRINQYNIKYEKIEN